MEKFENKATKDFVSAMLKEQILKGAILDGTELTQEEVAAQLHISRIPVREAFQNLINEGFLRRKNNRHIEVIGVSPGTIRQILRVAAAIETEVCILLAESEKPVQSLKAQAALMKQWKQMEVAGRWADHMQQMHRQFSEILDIPYISSQHEKILSGYPAYIWGCVHIERDSQIELLNRLIQAIVHKDINLITATSRKCFDELAEVLIRELKEKE